MPAINSIAIVGSGISGISTAYLLKDKYDVTIFEKNQCFGGHSNTVDLPIDGRMIPVDTGFIVFNHRTYPNLVAFFEHLNIQTFKSDMSFSVSLNEGALEYCGSSINQFFAQRKNIFNPKFLRMGLDILKFNKMASKFLWDSQTIDELVISLGLSNEFKDGYLYPMAGAIWSTSTHDIGQFPAKSMIQFLQNHGLLTVTNQPQWYTVKGGSRTYVEKALADKRLKKMKDAEVKCVSRSSQGIEIVTSDQKQHSFDAVIFSSPAHKSLEALEEPTELEKKILGQFRYGKNLAYLHRDPSLMPKNKRAWASWNYFNTSKDSIPLTYWMNKLQALETEENVFVTLNPSTSPAPNLTHSVIEYEHPLFDQAAIEAQSEIENLQGYKNTWYCGAYQKYGFHEDGLLSALMVVNDLGVRAPWQ